MRVPTIFLLFLIVATQTIGQEVYENYSRQNATLKIGNGNNDFLPYNEKGFTLIFPDKKDPLKGIIISLDDERFDIKNTPAEKLFHPQANAQGFAVLYISTGIPIDLYFKESSLAFVDSLLKTIFKKYNLANNNIFLLGDMVSGHRALKYIEYCQNGKSGFNPKIKGLILSESAIDWVRQWYEGQKQVRDHLTDVGFFEGNLVTYLFKVNLKDTPITNINKYINFSPYSYFDTKMQKPKLYKHLAIRAYTYADIRYWFSAQGKGVYDSNYPDMSGFINEQKLVGNKKAELIVFHSKPDDPLKDNLRKQSSTWDLVDKNELVEWIMLQTE